MKKYFLSSFSDGILSGFIFFIVFSSVFSFIKDKTLLFLSGGVFSALFSAFIISVLLRREKINYAEKREKEKTKNLIYYLKISDQKKEFIKALSSVGKSPKLLDNGLILCDNEYILPYFKFSKISFDDLTEIFLAYKGYEITIYTEKPDEEITAFLNKHFKFNLKEESDTYLLFLSANILPSVNYFESEKKINFKNFSKLFCKKKFASFFFSGLTFILFSYLTPFKIYYISVGAFLLLFATLCLIVPQKKVKRV